MLGVGLLTLVILTMTAMVLTTLRSNQKGLTVGPAAQVAESFLDSELYRMDTDNPPGSRALFWSTNGVWKDSSSSGQLVVGGQSYDYRCQVSTLMDTSGVAAGSVSNEAGNRLKKVDLSVWWMGARLTGDRAGMGRLEYATSRIISEQTP